MNLKNIAMFTKITNMELNYQFNCLTDLSRYNKDANSFNYNSHIFDLLSTIKVIKF